jgi:hypothetical protein
MFSDFWSVFLVLASVGSFLQLLLLLDVLSSGWLVLFSTFEMVALLVGSFVSTALFRSDDAVVVRLAGSTSIKLTKMTKVAKKATTLSVLSKLSQRASPRQHHQT